MGLEFRVNECAKCPELVDTRSQIVNGVGSGEVGLMFIGEAPGRDEDKMGEPFVGRSGELLTQKLGDMDVDMEEVRITNSVRCRPPGNRNPWTEEIDNCRGYLVREIESVSPSVICTLGRVPTENMIGDIGSMKEVVGVPRKEMVNGKEYDLVPCYHPAAMLYDRSKEDVFMDSLKTAVDLAMD